MRRSHLLISGAWLLHAIAWFLPVVKGGVTFPHGLPGWQAFRVAACPVWPYEGLKIDEWYNAVLSVISAATTVLFILGSVLVLSRRSSALRRASAWIATFAFVVNAHWYVLFGSDRKDLHIGYFLWWFSFLFVGLGLFDLSTRRTDEVTSPTADASELTVVTH
jgi:lysylphosphatidylglycerol synthetase-like protein (DUF2156 family)